MKNKNKITKKELTTIVSGVIIGVGSFLLIYNWRDQLMTVLNPWQQVLVGIFLILGGAYFFNLK